MVESFVEDYNQSWLLEKLGYDSPLKARLKWNAANSAELAEGEEDTATFSSVPPKDRETEPIKTHRAPSVEEDTATFSSVPSG